MKIYIILYIGYLYRSGIGWLQVNRSWSGRIRKKHFVRPDPEYSGRPDPEQSVRPDPEISVRPDPENSVRPDPEHSVRPDPEHSKSTHAPAFSVCWTLCRTALQRAVSAVPAAHAQARSVLALAVERAARVTLPALALLPRPACRESNRSPLRLALKWSASS
jgi:hypothetical protein